VDKINTLLDYNYKDTRYFNLEMQYFRHRYLLVFKLQTSAKLCTSRHSSLFWVQTANYSG